MHTYYPDRTTIPLPARRAARAAAGSDPRMPVALALDPYAPPHEEGSSWEYRTAGEQPIHHPSAYAKRGWSSMIYRHSTRRVVVGRAWLAEHAGLT